MYEYYFPTRRKDQIWTPRQTDVVKPVAVSQRMDDLPHGHFRFCVPGMDRRHDEGTLCAIYMVGHPL